MITSRAWRGFTLGYAVLISLCVGCSTFPKRNDPGQTATNSMNVGDLGSQNASAIKVDQQIQPATSALRPSPEEEVFVHLDLARALDVQGHHDKATAEYQKGIQRYKPALARRGSNPDKARLHRRMAAALDRVGRFDDAREHFALAIKHAPEDPSVWNDAGYSAYLQGNLEEAEKHLRKAVSLDPSDARALTNLGLTLAARGQLDAAYDILARAGSPASAHANIAFVLAAQGRTEESQAYYEKSLKTDPDLRVAKRALAKLARPKVEPEAMLTTHESSETP